MVYISIIVVLCPPLSFQTVTTISDIPLSAMHTCVWCLMSQSGENTSPQEIFHLCEGFCKDHLSNIGGMVQEKSCTWMEVILL